MCGSGAVVFAVWGYCLSNAKWDEAQKHWWVEVNSKILAAVLGEPEPLVIKAIDLLCSPDANSRTKTEGGRRLVKIGQFDYRIVNYAIYRAIKSIEDRREYQRIKQAEYRAKKKNAIYDRPKPKPLPGETVNVQMERDGASQRDLDTHAANTFKESETPYRVS